MNRTLETGLIALGAVAAVAVGVHYYSANKVSVTPASLVSGDSFRATINGQSQLFLVNSNNTATRTIQGVNVVDGTQQFVPYTSITASTKGGGQT